jgi:transcriptional pleiotropic regulator of transition state genes
MFFQQKTPLKKQNPSTFTVDSFQLCSKIGIAPCSFAALGLLRQHKLYVWNWKGMREMKSTGIVRKVDELGRIVLPIELRRTLDIAERDSLEIYIDGSSVVMKKFQPACIFCDSAKEIVSFHGKNVCPKCIRALQELPKD